MSHPPSLGKPLSRRARALLARAVRERALRSPAVVAERLRRTGQPVFESALAFQAVFGGTAWKPEGYDNALGLWLRSPPPRPDLSPLPKMPFVRIGSVRGDGDSVCYLDARGGVWNSYGGRSETFSAYLEQVALREALDRPAEILEVTVRPPLGPPLARALGLSPVPEATDAYQSWWMSRPIDLWHPTSSHPAVDFASSDLLLASTLGDAVRVIEAATALRPGTGFGLSFRPGVSHERPPPGHPDSMPDPMAWKDVPGARQLPMRARWDDVKGVLWVLGSGDALRVEDYRLAEDGSVLDWTTYTPGLVRARSFLGRG